MYKSTFLIFALTCSSVFADQSSCPQPRERYSFNPPLGYEVAGSGKLHFYSAPTEKCIVKKVFVVPKDQLIAYEEHGSWTYVMFMANDGREIEGWVKTKRLKFVGTEGYTPPADLEFYEKAMKAAESGKLGSPFDSNK